MSGKSIFKLLLDLSKAGRKANFFQVLDSYSLLNINPEHISPRNISILINSFGYFPDLPQSNWRLMENYFHSRKQDMNVHDLTLTIWGFCQSDKSIHDLTWKSLELSTRQNLMTFSPKELSSICYSFAWSTYQSPRLWESLKYAVIRQIFYMNAENVTPVVWAFSKAGIKDEKLWEILEKKVYMEIRNMDPKSHNVLANSFASIGKGSEDFWSLFEKIFYENTEVYSDKDVSMLSSSFRKAGIGKTLKFGNHMLEVLRTKSKEYSVGTIVSFGHAIRESMGTVPEFNDILIENMLNEEKVQKMSYGHVMNCARLLFHLKLKDNGVWDNLAVRLRQLIKSHPGIDIRGHLYFVIRDKSYWSFVCEESFLLYFERVLKMEPSEMEKAVKKEVYADFVTLAFFCFTQKVGSRQFWKQCGRFLLARKFGVEELSQIEVAKLMKMISDKLWESEGLRNYWFEYEYEICEKVEVMESIMRVPKAFRLVMKSFMKLGRVENILKQAEKVYQTMELEDKEVKRFLEKIMSWKNEDKTVPSYEAEKVARVLEEYDGEKQREILKGVFEHWFNVYLGREYSVRGCYLDVYEKLAKEEEVVTVISQEVQGKVSEEEDEAEDVKEEVEEGKEEEDEVVKKIGEFKMEGGVEVYDVMEEGKRDQEDVKLIF